MQGQDDLAKINIISDNLSAEVTVKLKQAPGKDILPLEARQLHILLW